ncbi:MFS transporter [Geobacter sp. AOG2]|uniref:spinster family MFS transporter n=1 Tax=Geobacter sp. AOG2 TaxID=1566347 RepID=UPI001CC800B6|nr:MFS transporter [Geobacter sp. AOG2]GFE59984.1 MFS transporter [Geobacter sp. AOG2]
MNDPTGRHCGRYALTVLLAVNLLNYIDRQALYAVFPLIKVDLHLTDTALGLLGSAFMLSYMLAAPFFGRLGDRHSRSRLAAGGLLAWSLATMLSGWAASYRLLLTARSLVGIGEASFGTVSPGLVADFFPRERRGRVLSLFFLAIPVGSALGYVLGGALGQAFGWRTAFMLVGLPGLVLSLPLLFLAEPRRGKQTPDGGVQGERFSSTLRRFLANRTFVHSTLSMAAMTFALGGLAQWVPSFLHRTFSLDVARGNTLFGMLTVVAGIIGTLAGGWLGDRLQRTSAAGYLHISAAGFLVGAPMAALAILSRSLPFCLGAIFAAELFLFLNTGPLNTVLVNVVAPNRRALGFAINIFAIHALGDAVSPAIIGALSDVWGLSAALLITPLAILVAAGFAFLAGRFVAEDQRAVEA